MKNGVIFGLAIALLSSPAMAHGKKKHNEAQAEPAEMVEAEFGMTGDPKAVGKTITMVMSA